MSKIILITEPHTLRIRAGGHATANIWLQMNEKQFPMLHWNDFAVVIMGAWAISVLRLIRGESTRETVFFMDGPFAVEIAFSAAKMLGFRAIRRGVAKDVEVATGEEAARQFIAGLISQSGEILHGCNQKAWWSRDADILKSSIVALKSEATRL